MKHSYFAISIVTILVGVFISLESIDDAFAYASRNSQDSLSHVNTVSQLNKYYNYVHLQPEWNSYPSNIIFDVSVFWDRDHTQTPDTTKHGGAINRVNTLQYLGTKSYVEVQYDYVDCNSQWIHYARHGIDMWNSYLDYWTGKQTTYGYDSASFSKIPSNSGPTDTSSVFLQFIPLCTSKDITSFEYGIRIDDSDVGFDVYFVPSIHEKLAYYYNYGFDYYDECRGLGYSSFSGTCQNVGKESGLLIVLPDTLQKPLTKVTIKLKEIEN